MKVLLTGGHVTPALAVIDELRKKKNDLYFVGRKYANRIDRNETFEYKEVKARDIPFFHLETGRLTRLVSITVFNEIGLLLKGLLTSSKILKKVKPDVIISFGGYIALPVAIIGKLHNIPIITHEQTIEPGLSNKLIAKFATKVCVSFPKTKEQFGRKGVVTGNPIRSDVYDIGTPLIQKKGKKPILFVTGGSLGAHRINIHIENILPELLKTFTIIHQTGNVQEYGDFERLSNVAHKGYYPKKHISTEDIGWVLNNANVIVSRSGANTVFEIMALGIPAVLIPLPWSARDEQMKHARFLKKSGVAEVFEQDEDSKVLLNLINSMYKRRPAYLQNFKKIDKLVKRNAARRIVTIAEHATKNKVAS